MARTHSSNVKPWPQPEPEPTFPVALLCGCALRFPEPLPEPGDRLWCRMHKSEVRVAREADD